MIGATLPTRGILIATLAAGPIFVLSMVVAAWLAGPGDVVAPPSIEIGAILAGSFAASLFGAIVAGPANLLGAAAMTWLGIDNVGVRHPAMWGLAGGLATGSTAFLAGADHDFITVWAMTGTLCALLCRVGMRWQ